MSDYELKQDFEAEVLAVSEQTPVLVDFWAEWCGPCRILGPILQKLAGEADGAWKLVKVDTEAHPELAEAFAIRAIPSVKLFSGGRPVAEFQGALPEARVRDWLQANLPAKSSGDVAKAREAMERGDATQARVHLQRALAHDPRDTEAALLLARLLFPTDPDAAADLVASIPEEDPGHDTAGHILRLRDWLQWARSGAPLSGRDDGDDAVARYRDAALALGEGRTDAALDILIDLVSRDRELDDDGVRKALVGIFALLGDDHELTRRFRPRFASALY